MAQMLITVAQDEDKEGFQLVQKNGCENIDGFADALFKDGHTVTYADWKDFDGEEFTRTFTRESPEQELHQNNVPLASLDLILIQKMEGWLSDLPRYLGMIDRFEDLSATVINDPKTIRHNLDKGYLWELGAAHVPVVPTYQLDHNLEGLLGKFGKVVIKPRRGERGKHQIVATSAQDVKGIETPEDYLVQPYLPRVREGEKSLVFLGLDFHHAVLKVPNPDDPSEHRANLSNGGIVTLYEPTQKEIEVAHAALNAYHVAGYPVHLSRIDLIHSDKGPVVSEAELLNPDFYLAQLNNKESFNTKLASYLGRLTKLH